MRTVWRGLLATALLLLAGAAAAVAEDEPRWWSLSTSFNYSVGDYGTNDDTTLIYIPVTLGVRPVEWFSLRLTVPYIRQTSQNVVVTGGGVAVRKEGQGKLARPAESTTEDGIGDVLLRGSFIVVKEGDLVPEIAPYLKIKFPTADEDRGLGTGEFDYTIGVDLSKRLVGDLYGYATLAYTFIGDPPGSEFDNSFGWSVGVSYAVTPPFSVFAFVDGATAISDQPDPVELRVGAEYRLTKNVKLTGAVSRGLTDGAADWGISAGLALRF